MMQRVLELKSKIEIDLKYFCYLNNAPMGIKIQTSDPFYILSIEKS